MIHIHVTKTLNTADGVLNAEFAIDIRNGEFLTLFGPSGAGKTTLMRLIAGLETPNSGVIEVEGEVWFDKSRKNQSPSPKTEHRICLPRLRPLSEYECPRKSPLCRRNR
jgi:molybdate transport system ATP-binding protein